MLTVMLTVENITTGTTHDVWEANVEEEHHEEATSRVKERDARQHATGRDAPVIRCETIDAHKPQQAVTRGALLLEEREHVVRVLLLHGEDVFEQSPGRHVSIAYPAYYFPVRLDRDALGDEILFYHRLEVATLHILRMAACRKAFGVEVGLSLELHDPGGYAVRMLLFLAGMLSKLAGSALGLAALRHEVVALVAKHADKFGGEGVVEHVDHPFHIGGISIGYRPALDLLACPFA